MAGSEVLGTKRSFNANDRKLCAGITQQSHSLVSTWDNCAAGTNCRDAGSPAQVSPWSKHPPFLPLRLQISYKRAWQFSPISKNCFSPTSTPSCDFICSVLMRDPSQTPKISCSVAEIFMNLKTIIILDFPVSLSYRISLEIPDSSSVTKRSIRRKKKAS